MIYISTHAGDLLCLDWARPSHTSYSPLLSKISTPLDYDAWDHALAHHPDRAFAHYILRGIREGFRIGFDYNKATRSASKNLPSADLHPEVIHECLAKEIRLGRMLGPFGTHALLPSLQINRFGVIPKGHNTGKWQLITDLSPRFKCY